jgi:hypothetical protein
LMAEGCTISNITSRLTSHGAARTTSPATTGSTSQPGRHEHNLLDICFKLVSCLSYSSTLKMEVTCSSKMSVDIQPTTQCYILEDWTLLLSLCHQLSFFLKMLI